MDRKQYKNEKELYKLFNQMNFDDKEFEDVEVSMNDIQKQQLKNNLKTKIKDNKKFNKSTLAASLLLVCFAGAAFTNTSLAKEVNKSLRPVINSILQSFNDKSGFNGDYKDFSQLVDKTKKYKNISCTINEVVCDDSSLIISYTIKVDKSLKNINREFTGVFLGTSIKINGKERKVGGGIIGEFKDDNTFVGVSKLDLDNLPNTFNVDLNIDKLFNIKGNWDFSFKVSKDILNNKTTVINPKNIIIKTKDKELNIDKITINPLNTRLFISGKVINPSKFLTDDFVIVDDKGRQLARKGSSATANSFKFQGQYEFESLKHIPKYITIIPMEFTKIHFKDCVKDKIIRSINEKLPIVLNQGDKGKLTITNIKIEKDRLKVDYFADGKITHMQALELQLLDENNKSVEQETIKRDKNNFNKYTGEFKIKTGKKYFFATNNMNHIKLNENLKVKVPILE